MDKQMLAWAVYLAGGLLFGLVVWRICRSWLRYVRHFLLVTYAVFVFTPFSLNLADKPDAYAPAFFIAVLNTLFLGEDAGLDAAVTLALIWVVALVLSLIYLLATTRWRKPKEEAPAAD
ncbi:hypothetical protein [Gilvimarinus chinensis]|uniref:hypothetical protein n=1 Tax=Gilvimarinus chinensis TaxID=396005 RepID=UPI00036615F6|nr:hypothetical protein [Gilvimarinus chinensis]